MDIALMKQEDKDAYLRQLADQPPFVTGYSIMADGMYGGVYQFPNNLNSLEIHVPPMTTLDAPPVAGVGEAAFWNGSEWELRPYVPNDGVSDFARQQAIELRNNPPPPMIPMPQGIPQPNAEGVYPITVLNAEGTAYEWVYPPQPPVIDEAPTP
jgi:hypothetical protein